MKNKYDLTPEERAGVKKFMRTIAHFKKLDQAFPQSYMEALMHIALQPGLGTSDYAQRIETSKSNASRILGIIGERPRRGDEHHDLIEQEDDPRDARKTHYNLTQKGYWLIKKILEEQQ